MELKARFQEIRYDKLCVITPLMKYKQFMQLITEHPLNTPPPLYPHHCTSTSTTTSRYAFELRRAILAELAREAEERRLMAIEEIRSAVPPLLVPPQVRAWLRVTE